LFLQADEFSYLQKACDGDYAGGCDNLGWSYGKGVKQNYKKTKEYFGKSCDLNEQFGCDRYKIVNEMGY
jgi:TPR repeat protein